MTNKNHINIGSQRELFVDYHLIDEFNGTKLKLQEPQNKGPAILLDQAWEGPKAFYPTILKDDDVYRMYYRSSAPGSPICYAESKDGATWTKPILNLIDIDGSSANNAILPGSPGHTFCPFIDTNKHSDKNQKYKANINVRKPTNLGLQPLQSSDGIHWNEIPDVCFIPPVLENHFDSQNVMFWSEEEKRYILFSRHMQEGRRATAKSFSKDFKEWSQPVLMKYSDTGTTCPDSQLYTNQTTPYFRAPHIYISLSARIFFADTKHINRKDDLDYAQNKVIPQNIIDHHNNLEELDIKGAGDYSDGVLLTSRAGTETYDFIFKESFIRPGIGINNWTSRNNYPALGLIPTSEKEMSFYVTRNYSQNTAFIERMVLRIDGLTSLNAPYSGGQMVTKPFIFKGEQLDINYSTSAAGHIAIEIQNADGTPITNFTLKDSMVMQGDEIKHKISWPGENSKTDLGGPSLKNLSGSQIRLKFDMKDADLFSIKFT